MALTKIRTDGLTDSSVSSAKILDATVANADLSATAAIAGSKLGTGAVLQMVSNNSGNQIATNSNSFQDVLTASITPKYTSSKIYMTFSTRLYSGNSSKEISYQWSRDSTSLDTGYSLWNTGGAIAERSTMSFVDSPSSTSSITYKIQIKSDGVNTVHVNPNGTNDGDYYLILMEIGG